MRTTLVRRPALDSERSERGPEAPGSHGLSGRSSEGFSGVESLWRFPAAGRAGANRLSRDASAFRGQGRPKCFTSIATLLLLGLCLLVLLGTGFNLPARAAERVTWYHNDLQDSPVAATDRNGDVVWREEYKPYGRRTLKEDGGSNKLWYTGKAHEEGTRLSYYGARWYHPEIGRFMAIDPVDFTEDNVQSFNRYAYANNNPYRYIDPDGMAPWDLDAAKRVASGFNLDAGFGPGAGPSGRGGGVGEKSISAIQAERNQIIANESARAAKGLPDNALVCRGGSCMADKFANGSGVTVDASGKLNGVSVNSAPGKSLKELTVGIPHSKVGVTTVGDVRRAGGDVVPSPNATNLNHATLQGITPQQGQELMTPTVRNPNAR